MQNSTYNRRPSNQEQLRDMTKEEILSQSQGEYMNAAQLDFFRNLLADNKKELQDKIDHVRSDLGEMQHNNDELDRASMEEETMLKLRIIERETKLIHKIDQSLKRIESGEYGYCEATGEPIGIPRLLARPTATLCAEEKNRQEVMEKYYRSD